jgi:hypothetical protein
MSFPRGGLLARSSPPHFTAFISVVALTVLGVGIGLYTAESEHQRVNREAKADALVSSSELKLLALKVPERDIAGIDEPTTFAGSVSGTDLFDANHSCVPPEEVLHRFQADQNTMGGKVVMLTEGLQQSFSDAWRLKAAVAPARVSSVVAHVFSIGTDWNADVVEFDVNRCAMSRTLVSGDVWNELLVASRDGQV